jgi:hypothetical protein
MSHPHPLVEEIREKLASTASEFERWTGGYGDVASSLTLPELARLLREALSYIEAAESRETALREALEKAQSAIRWALGEEGEFGEEPAPLAGKYRRRFWWRTELRERAALSSPAAPREGE